MDEIGQGGQEFLLRESGVASVDGLARQLRDDCAEAACLIDAALPVEAG